MKGVPHCQTCSKRSVSLFCDLSEEALQILETYKSFNRYRKGQYLFYAGNAPTGLYCISQGSVRIEVDGPLGKGHIVRVVKAGGILGHRALFAEENYNASAVAHEECEVCFISKEGVNRLVRDYPDIALKLLKQISRQLRESEQRFCSMTDKTASERVAESLLYFKEKFTEQNWTRKEIADWAGTTPETVIRTLSDFEDQGVIEQKGRKITITNRAVLADLANLRD